MTLGRTLSPRGLGREAPAAHAADPGGSVVGERRRGKRGELLLKVHLRFDLGGGRVKQETTVLEDFSAGGAKVQSKFEAAVGQTLEIDESEGVFCARAEVRGGYVGADGVRRLHLRFLPPPPALSPERRPRGFHSFSVGVDASAEGWDAGR